MSPHFCCSLFCLPSVKDSTSFGWVVLQKLLRKTLSPPLHLCACESQWNGHVQALQEEMVISFNCCSRFVAHVLSTARPPSPLCQSLSSAKELKEVSGGSALLKPHTGGYDRKGCSDCPDGYCQRKKLPDSWARGTHAPTGNKHVQCTSKNKLWKSR